MVGFLFYYEPLKILQPPLQQREDMEIEDVRQRLKDAGLSIKRENRMGNDLGTAIRLSIGAIVNCFDTGTVAYQGRNQDVARAAIEGGTGKDIGTPSEKVFVVYGHDQTARDQLEMMLRRWGLEPLILDKLPSEGQTIIEKLESYTTDVGFGVVLATPDDEGHRANRPDEKAYRARQNVVLELGMLLALLGRPRVAILLKQQANMERPSDVQGLIYIPFKDNLEKEAGLSLAKEMVAQGYNIDVAKI